jgi:hypothetical protein
MNQPGLGNKSRFKCFRKNQSTQIKTKKAKWTNWPKTLGILPVLVPYIMYCTFLGVFCCHAFFVSHPYQNFNKASDNCGNLRQRWIWRNLLKFMWEADQVGTKLHSYEQILSRYKEKSTQGGPSTAHSSSFGVGAGFLWHCFLWVAQ